MNTNPTLLITDDDCDFRESLDSLFRGRGFQTVLASNGGEACEVVKHRDVHLVLIDFHMPGMTGLEALQTIKQFNADLPVILMSARLDDRMSHDLLAADAFAVHAKPIDIGRIRQDVSTALQTIYNWSIDC